MTSLLTREKVQYLKQQAAEVHFGGKSVFFLHLSKEKIILDVVD
jgi:hypothetical protein